MARSFRRSAGSGIGGRLFAIPLALAGLLSGGAHAAEYLPGSLAIKAAALASPTPPQTARDVGQAMGYLDGHRLELFDADHDGSYDVNEWLEYSFAPYLVYNVQRDGRLTPDEYAQFFQGPREHPYPNIGPNIREIEQRFRRLDRGNKGYLTIEDFRGEATANFRENDVNHDGHVTQAEIEEVGRRR